MPRTWTSHNRRARDVLTGRSSAVNAGVCVSQRPTGAGGFADGSPHKHGGCRPCGAQRSRVSALLPRARRQQRRTRRWSTLEFLGVAGSDGEGVVARIGARERGRARDWCRALACAAVFISSRARVCVRGSDPRGGGATAIGLADRATLCRSQFTNIHGCRCRWRLVLSWMDRCTNMLFPYGIGVCVTAHGVDCLSVSS